MYLFILLSTNKFTWCFHKAKQLYCIHHANVTYLQLLLPRLYIYVSLYTVSVQRRNFRGRIVWPTILVESFKICLTVRWQNNCIVKEKISPKYHTQMLSRLNKLWSFIHCLCISKNCKPWQYVIQYIIFTRFNGRESYYKQHWRGKRNKEGM